MPLLTFITNLGMGGSQKEGEPDPWTKQTNTSTSWSAKVDVSTTWTQQADSSITWTKQ